MKWEDVSPQYIYIYIYNLRRTRHWRDSQRTRRYIKEVDQEVFISRRASMLCSSDVVVTRKTDGRDRITSSRKRFLYAELKSKRWKPTELWSIQRIRRWRFLTEWSLRYELHRYIDPISTLDCSDTRKWWKNWYEGRVGRVGTDCKNNVMKSVGRNVTDFTHENLTL